MQPNVKVVPKKMEPIKRSLPSKSIYELGETVDERGMDDIPPDVEREEQKIESPQPIRG